MGNLLSEVHPELVAEWSDKNLPLTPDIEKCKELSLYDTGVSAEYGDKLITLSTCEYSRTNGRLVVVAKKAVESSGANAPANDGAAEIPS